MQNAADQNFNDPDYMCDALIIGFALGASTWG
jgi:hypothetical protein